uniref:CSON008474 protein n=1 Tax=Culicoides sonorensis TaxID=179676 RepID=Q66U11_CULSO|nr:unknown salivary protein [Culicoides sonorensis]
MKNILIYMSILCLLSYPVVAGPAASSICYAGCAAVVVACFAAAGFTFGTVPGAQIAAVPALASCNAAFATCEAACMAAFFLPTP